MAALQEAHAQANGLSGELAGLITQLEPVLRPLDLAPDKQSPGLRAVQSPVEDHLQDLIGKLKEIRAAVAFAHERLAL